MNREQKLLAFIDRSQPGLEIGPSYQPIAPKSQGFNVRILDHCSQDDLRRKYRDTPSVDVSRIEPVDYIWSGEPLNTLVGDAKFSWIIASHVIEHTPDFIGFLRACEALMKSDGILSLAVPDHRYCFDRLREKTSLGQVIDAHEARRSRHSFGAICDFYLNTVTNNKAAVWGPDYPLGELAPLHPLEIAVSKIKSIDASNSEYLDVHSWVFTPSSFRLILHDLRLLGYTSLKEAAFFETQGCEFITAFSRGGSGPNLSRLQLQELAYNEQ